MKRILSVIALIAIFLSLTACGAAKGSVSIEESANGSGCKIEFSQWSGSNKCELPLNKDDELQVEIVRDSGDIALTICGKNGSEAYTGKRLDTGMFTVKVSEAGECVVEITGKNATGSIAIENLASRNLE